MPNEPETSDGHYQRRRDRQIRILNLSVSVMCGLGAASSLISRNQRSHPGSWLANAFEALRLLSFLVAIVAMGTSIPSILKDYKEDMRCRFPCRVSPQRPPL